MSSIKQLIHYQLVWLGLCEVTFVCSLLFCCLVVVCFSSWVSVYMYGLLFSHLGGLSSDRGFSLHRGLSSHIFGASLHIRASPGSLEPAIFHEPAEPENIVFHGLSWFFIVFSWFFKELDFKELNLNNWISINLVPDLWYLDLVPELWYLNYGP